MTARPLFTLVEGVGFEPTKAWPADLQSAPVDRLGTPPKNVSRAFSLMGSALSTISYCFSATFTYDASGYSVSYFGRSACTPQFSGDKIVHALRKVLSRAQQCSGRRPPGRVCTGGDQRPHLVRQSLDHRMGTLANRNSRITPGQPVGGISGGRNDPSYRPRPCGFPNPRIQVVQVQQCRHL